MKGMIDSSRNIAGLYLLESESMALLSSAELSSDQDSSILHFRNQRGNFVVA